MKEYNIKYELKGTGCLTFVANSAEEAEEEFDRIMCGDKPQIEDNEWITDDVIYDLEWNLWDVEVLDTREE
jgi:hypothetical protein